MLELAILDGVDERVDTAVEKRQSDGDLKVPAGKDETVCRGKTGRSQHMSWSEADNETAADEQRSDHCVASGGAYRRTACRSNLKT